MTEDLRASSSDPTEDSIGGERILIVDDDPAIRTMLSDILLPERYLVELAEGSGEALEKLVDYNFQLLLLDAKLPGISGFELLKYCKRYHPDMEIIMITGNPEIDDAISTVKDGAFDYLAKPFSVEKLLSRVRDALKTQKSKLRNKLSFLPGMSESHEHLKVGSPLPGYKVLRTLGSGSMGVVLLVENDSMKYALKILRKVGEGAANEARVNRFLREADILSRINHRNIIHIYRSGFPDNGDVPFILMEYVEGRPLTDIIKKGEMNLEQKVDIMKQIATALAIVHSAGIIHRDIKPGNVLVTPDNTAKLSDFGISHIIDSSLTMSHEILGSPAYMPPEAFNSTQGLDFRSDIFSLGVLGYELFTGTKPFHGETVAEIMGAIQKVHPADPVKLVPELPPEIQKILARMLKKDPARRYQNINEVITDINLFRKGERPPSPFFRNLVRKIVEYNKTWS